MSRAFIGFLVAAAWLTACGDGGLGGGGGDGCSKPYGTANQLSLELSTSEVASGGPYFMVVGEVGGARAYTGIDGLPLGSRAVTLGSSDPSIVRVSGDAASATITAVSAGSATISAFGCGLTEKAVVEVSAAPLPIDSLHVWTTAYPVGATVTNDSNGNLVVLVLPAGSAAVGLPAGTASILVQAIRNGKLVVGPALEPALASSDNAVAEIFAKCLPPDLAPSCFQQDGWIVGRRAGTVEMRVTVRNITWSFQVQVTTP